MKISDSKGEYTPAEIKAALAGVDGTRQMSYRYERLDSNNNYIEDIDYIQSCTINYDALADIKRTAKFEILDNSPINYLSDRIKPYVRLTMPGAGTDGRSGYVEWPQGVFILSSPKRSFKEGNYVVREVDGFDQIVHLKEESLDSRFAVAAGDSYTDAVKAIAATSLGQVRSIPIDDRWADTAGVGSNTPTNITPSSLTLFFKGPDRSDYRSAYVTAVIDGFSATAKVVPTDYTNGQFTAMYLPVTDMSILNSAIEFRIWGGSIQADSGQLGAPYYANYDPVAHAYLRIREASKVLYFETSSNGSTWNFFYSIPSAYQTGARIGLGFETFYSGYNQVATTTYTATVSNVNFTAVSDPGINVTNSTLTLPTAMEWEVGTPKLRILNDLLAAANYDSAFFDENGVFIGRPYVAPQYRTSEYEYLTDSQSVITGDVNQTLDLYAIPNKWVISVSEPDRPLLVSSYTNSNPLSALSTVSRGRTIVDYRTEQNAPDQATLDAQVARLAFEASQVYEVIEFDTGLMPIHQHADVFDIALGGMAVSAKFAEHGWSMDLSNGSVMHHKIRKITTI